MYLFNVCYRFHVNGEHLFTQCDMAKRFRNARLNIFGGEVANDLNPVYGGSFIKAVARVIHIRQNQMLIYSERMLSGILLHYSFSSEPKLKTQQSVYLSIYLSILRHPHC